MRAELSYESLELLQMLGWRDNVARTKLHGNRLAPQDNSSIYL